MKNIFAIVAVFALLFLAACAPQEPVQPSLPEGHELPPAPAEPEPIVEETQPASDEVVEINDGLDDAFGPRVGDQVITVDDIRCDAETSTVTFRFRNLDTKSWQLDQNVPFPAPKDLGGVRVTLNSYEVNGRQRPLSPTTGDELFGPEAKFSANCGGVEVLAPNEEAVCTVSPVLLKSETAVAAGANEIRINGAGKDGLARFSCE